MLNLSDYIIFPLGDSALTLDFGNTISTHTNDRVQSLAQQIRQRGWPFIKDIVPAYSSLTIHYDISLYPNPVPGQTVFDAISALIEKLLKEENTFVLKSRHINIPVCYAEKFAWDLHEIASMGTLAPEEVIRLHTSLEYRVYMIGFLPGFAYMGEVDERIAMPRKAQPRTRIEAGSVGIAGRQTGIYPLPSPGGWQIVGRTPLPLFDPASSSPALLQPGDVVRFFSISEHEFAAYQKRTA